MSQHKVRKKNRCGDAGFFFFDKVTEVRVGTATVGESSNLSLLSLESKIASSSCEYL